MKKFLSLVLALVMTMSLEMCIRDSAQFLWLRHGRRCFQHDDPALREAPRFLKTTGQGNGSQDRGDHGDSGHANHHHHRHRSDPWRVHPQRNRGHQPFFLRGKACRLRGDRSNLSLIHICTQEKECWSSYHCCAAAAKRFVPFWKAPTATIARW